MSKKHFEAAAEYVRETYPQGGTSSEYHAVVDAFVAVFKGANDRFDEARFRAACRAQGGAR